jgi:hypothetical protein
VVQESKHLSAESSLQSNHSQRSHNLFHISAPPHCFTTSLLTMCCSNRAQRLHHHQQQQQLLQYSVLPRGCCGARKERRLLRKLQEQATTHYESSAITPTGPQGFFLSSVREYHSPMAGIIAVGISMGAEKLGRKISEKRLERKDKAAVVRLLLILCLLCLICNSATRSYLRSCRDFICQCSIANQRLVEAGGEERGSAKRARTEWKTP